MALGNDGIRPDALELRIRFACGAIAGSLAGAWWAGHRSSGGVLALFVAVGGLIGGALARYFGDRFWASFRRKWPF
jgi:membrane associated rhomboid family serine protease